MVVLVGGRRHALPLERVERVERMASLTPLPGAPPGVVGALNVRGRVLPVVDPRPRLGLPTPPVEPGQALLVLSARTRYMLWVDAVDRVQTVAETLPTGAGAASVVVRLDDEAVPLLAPEAFDPGPVIAEVAT